jgi:hypothetical protein
MKKLISITTAGEFADALEDWIIDNKCNPTTAEEWARCIKDLTASGVVNTVGVTEASTRELKEGLKENLNVKDLGDK